MLPNCVDCGNETGCEEDGVPRCFDCYLSNVARHKRKTFRSKCTCNAEDGTCFKCTKREVVVLRLALADLIEQVEMQNEGNTSGCLNLDLARETMERTK